MLDSEKEKHMKQLKRKIECWRELIIPLNSILLWEKSWYPGLILGSTTTLFLLIWIMEPAFLTIISMIMLLLTLTDYFVVVISSTFFPSSGWNGQKERKLDEICKTLSETTLQIQSIWKFIINARHNRPNLYYGLITLCLSLSAWLGNLVNNLLLIYVAVNIILLSPGFRHKDLVQSAVKIGCNYLMHRKQA
ncbi:hypothetical protein PV327_007474 [Microctonus hyperodae]|uniref:RETREG1-3/ARL6IP-like N-terminal reticulon-homology domain-containing protein n=1 Tax=Microctonus hyperodae TaxID=165561 RepID=A0AA39FZP6_MICHY|nr:hypothetical protein PV327_007474 [Microctonus hyperodae]